MMPISRRHLFVATRLGDDETLEMIKANEPDDLVRQVNKAVVSRASVFVGASSLDQLEFVTEHFATENHETIIKGVAKRYREEGA